MNRWLWSLALIGCAETLETLDPTEGEAPVEIIFEDADGDTIADVHERLLGSDDSDRDEDGLDNARDVDSDDDGLRDALEAGDDDIATLPIDSDDDLIPDFLDFDSDNNCIDDKREGREDSDGDGRLDAHELDDDDDGLSDLEEMSACGVNRDTDGDGRPDRADTDSDDDGLPDAVEGRRDSDGDGTPDRLDLDSDDNGVPDSAEGADDLDGDGIPDFRDSDDDGDGLPDMEETERGLDPRRRDSDGDGQSDLLEDLGGSNPADPDSTVEGTVVEIRERTEVEVSLDYTLSLRRADLVLLLDTTTSMSAAIGPAITDLIDVSETLASDLVDPRLGVARFQEYAAQPMSSGRDVPFKLEQQLTNDIDKLTAAIRSVTVDPRAGNRDWPEAAIEGMYQAMTGKGYDLQCDGSFDPSTDVLPFLSAPSDPFAGAAGQGYRPGDPSTGLGGGMGFRPRATPVLIVVTDAELRDPDDGYAVPGGCPTEAGSDLLISEMNARGAKVIGLALNERPVPQFETLGTATDSFADLTGDGAPDSLVFDYTPGDVATRAKLVTAVTELSPEVEIDEIALTVVSDEQGFIVDVGAPYRGVTDTFADGDRLPFSISLRGAVPGGSADAVHRLLVQVTEDGEVAQEKVIWAVVRGRQG